MALIKIPMPKYVVLHDKDGNRVMWHLVEVRDGTLGTSTAQTVCKGRTIIYIKQLSASLMHETITHELFHAGGCEHGLDGAPNDTWWNSEHPTNDSHPGVYHLGEFTSLLMQDNPQLAYWLAGDEN